MPAMTLWRLLSTSTAFIRSRSAAACSKRSSSAACSICSFSSRTICLDLPESSAAACSMRAAYSSWDIVLRQKPSHRPMWKFRQGRWVSMSRGNWRLQVGSFRALQMASMAWRVSYRPPKGPKYRAPSLAWRLTMENRG